MPDSHLWIVGGRRATRAASMAAATPTASADCHRRLRGPYTGTGSLMRALVPAVHAQRPSLAPWHAFELLAVAPELEALIGAVPQTLTSAAPQSERTRWYSRYRTRRISHGLVDFLRSCAADGPLTLALGSVDQADPTDVEFISLALRRLDPAQVRLVVSSAGDVPELTDSFAAYCTRHDVTDPDADIAAVSPEEAAAAFVRSDGTSDVPGEYEAYQAAGPEVRARLHDERAAELAGRGERSLELGAIFYHLLRGSSLPKGKKHGLDAAGYCLGMAFYDATMELTGEMLQRVDRAAEPDLYELLQVTQCQCLALLERPEETEPIYYDMLSATINPKRHMNFSYALAMLYTRLYGPDRKDHHKARALVNTAIAIASLLEDPEDRIFHTVFMSNGKALIEMHLGNLAESLRLVEAGIARMDQELSAEKHLLHRSVLVHNRAQVLAGLGRPEEAMADFDHVIELDPNYPEYHFDRGNQLTKLGRYDEAFADYEAAIRLSPPFPELYFNRGDLRATTGDADGAVSDFRYVLDLEPDYLEARISLASLLLDAGDAQAAADQVRAGLAFAPDEARLHCTLGLALLDLGDRAAARAAFSRAVELDPELFEALVNRAVAAFEDGEPDAAVADLTAALDLSDGDPDLLFNRGLAYEAASRPADAVADYTAALQAGQDDPADLLYHRGRCLVALDRPAEARDDLGAHLACGESAYEDEVRELLASLGEPSAALAAG